MHFLCRCGNRIYDTTDYISYKAYILSDQDCFDYTDEIERYVADKALDADACMNHIMHIDVEYMWRKIYQCSQCGRIFIEDKSGGLHSFAPEGTEDKRLLRSVKAEDWRGFLHGEWDEVRECWSEHQGYLSADTNDEKFPRWQDFDSWKDLEREYYALFEKLRQAGRIRSASLKRGREWVHKWSIDEENNIKSF